MSKSVILSYKSDRAATTVYQLLQAIVLRFESPIIDLYYWAERSVIDSHY